MKSHEEIKQMIKELEKKIYQYNGMYGQNCSDFRAGEIREVVAYFNGQIWALSWVQKESAKLAEKQPKETISATISPNGVQDKG